MTEPLVLVPSSAEAGARPLITIEPQPATWRAVEGSLQAHHPDLLRRRLIRVESFSAALQMVRAGFGDGLVPLGLALEAGLAAGRLQPLRRVRRTISLLTRKSTDRRAPGRPASRGRRLLRGRARARRATTERPPW